MPKERRANGEGTYRTLPSGLIQNLVQVDGKKYSGTGTSKAKALAARKANQIRRAEERDARRGRSFSTCLLEAAETSAKRDAPTTAETHRSWAQSLARDPLGQIPVNRVTAKDLASWWERTPLALASKRKRLSWYKKVLKAEGNAVEWTAPRSDDGGHERRPLDPLERARLDALEPEMPDDLRMAYRLCKGTGLRLSEAVGLRHDDRDGDGVRIRRTVTKTSGTLHVRPRGKNRRALAWVPLPAFLRSEIGPPRTGFVIGGGENPAHPRDLSDALRSFMKRANVGGAHAGFHALRRTFGMMLLESGADVVTAARAMRHDPGTLLKEYARSRDDLTVEAVNRAFGDAPKTPLKTGRRLIRRTHRTPHGPDAGSK